MYAEEIIVLEDGQIKFQDSYSNLIHQGNLAESTEVKALDIVSDDSGLERTLLHNDEPTVTSNNEIEDLMRRAGDSSLYFYYFKSVGWILCMLGLSTGIIAIFIQFFSRKSYNSYIPVGDAYFSLTQDLEIWLKWWGERNSLQDNENSTMYFGIYVLLLALIPGFVALDCW